MLLRSLPPPPSTTAVSSARHLGDAQAAGIEQAIGALVARALVLLSARRRGTLVGTCLRSAWTHPRSRYRQEKLAA
jgi:hypothetical protein